MPYILSVIVVFFMVQAMVEIPERANQILNIVKAKHNLRTKSDAISLVVMDYGAKILEPELKPKYLKKLSKLKKETGISFKSISDLRKIIEG